MPGEEAPKGPFPIRPPTGTRRPALAAGAAQAVHQQPTGSELGPPRPAIRANPCPEVTDPFCRLPLPTLFYRPEAVNLGDLLRIWVRLGARVISQEPRGLATTSRTHIFKGRHKRFGHHKSRGAFRNLRP